MIDLKSASGRRVLSSLIGHRLLLAFDFDGTLASLAPHPDRVRFDPAIERLLFRLEECVPVAIVTGRSRDDLRRFFRSPPRIVIGNHGVEGTSGHERLHRVKEACSAWRLFLEPLLRTEAPTNKAWLEDKTYSLTIHCHIPSLLQRIHRLLEQPLPLPGIRFVSGKASINLIPVGMPTKADAMLSLLERLRCDHALYVGDDITDEDVFSLRDSRVVGVRVGTLVSSKAKFYLRSQQEILWLLETLLKLVAPSDVSMHVVRRSELK